MLLLSQNSIERLSFIEPPGWITDVIPDLFANSTQSGNGKKASEAITEPIKFKLKLVAFSGDETEHTIIPFGRGVCGQVANSNKPLIVPDVKSEKNYISCNINVKSEIVVPILKNNINIGQIDVDSNTINAFSDIDKIFLEEICELVSKNYVLNNN